MKQLIQYNENLSEDDVTKNEDVTKNFIKVVEDGIDVSEMALGGNTGVWLKKNIDGANTTTEAHEFGHGLGLEHPESTNLIGKGQPGIMHPRGTLVDAEFTYDPKQGASKVNSDGVPMNSVNPNKRKVLQSDIDNLNLGSQFYDTNGRGNLGGLTNTFHK